MEADGGSGSARRWMPTNFSATGEGNSQSRPRARSIWVFARRADQEKQDIFLVDFEALRQNDPFNIDAFVPTALERTGDFRQFPCSPFSIRLTLRRRPAIRRPTLPLQT